MGKVPGEAMAPLQSNTQVGTMTEVKDLIPQAIIMHDISPMPAGHSMMTKRIKGSIGTEWIHGCPVPATTLWPSGTHLTRGASPNQLKGPLIAKWKNEGIITIIRLHK